MKTAQIEQLIRESQAEAAKSVATGNPPFGCVITDVNGHIVARDYNTQNTDNDPTAHAEIKALRQLGKKIGSRYLDGYIMFSNASSCSMCMSGSIKAHIKDFYYGAPPEPSMDPWLPMEKVAAESRGLINIIGPILGDECTKQISDARSQAK